MTDEVTEPEVKAPAKRAAKTAALPQDIGHIIPAIREELGAIGKDQRATAGATFQYRGHDEIVNAIVPLFNKYGVYVTVEDEHLHYAGRPANNNKWATAAVIRKAVTFWAPDGSSRTSTIVAESVDNGNKATSQAQTYAYRIAITQTFTIPTGEPDPDSSGAELGTPEPAAVPTQPKAAATVDEDVEALKADVTALFAARDITKPDEILAEGTRFFNGREGWTKQAAPLRKLKAFLESGQPLPDNTEGGSK